MYLKQYPKSIECFEQANSIQRHDCTFMQLGKVHLLMENQKAALEVYADALEHSPDNAELLTTVGLLHLRMGESIKAFDYLGNSLTHNPKNAKTIMAAASIMQDNNDHDVALVKYRVAAIETPNSAQLWNNIGMAFFAKKKYIAAIACLKRAAYLDPFEWIIAFNLGLLHLTMEQYASAFHHFSAASNLKPEFAQAYMYLGVTLCKLGDVGNARAAYERALELDGTDHLCHMNYAISLLRHGMHDEARAHYSSFEQLYSAMDEHSRLADDDVIAQRKLLQEQFS